MTNKTSKKQEDNDGPYKVESELASKLDNLIHEYDGILSCVVVVGILEMIKADIIEER